MVKTRYLLAGLVLGVVALPGSGGDRQRQAELEQAAGRDLYLVLGKCQDPQVSRRQLLAFVQAVADKYPNAGPRARQVVATLEAMLAEDKGHAARAPARPLAWLTTRERVAELIYRLREQTGHEPGQHWICDIF